MKILLFGYNGHFNLGDDLLLKLAYEAVTINKIDISISTTNKEGVTYLKNWFPDADVIFHPSPGKIFRKFNKILYVGGNLIFNYERKPSIIMILHRKLSMIKIFSYASFMGTKFGAISLGIGPFNSKSLEKTLLNSLNVFSLLLVRDEKSFEYAEKYSSQDAIIKKYSDLSVCEYDNLKSKRRRINKIESILIIIRSISIDGIDSSYINTLKEFANQKRGEGKRIIWCSLQKNNDKDILKEIPSEDRFWQWNPEKMVLKDFYNLVGSADMVITSRMHGLFISGMLNIPTIGIRLHSKFDTAASVFGKQVLTISPKMDLEELLNTYDRIIKHALSHDIVSRPNNIVDEVNEAKKAYQTLSDWVNR